MPHNLSTSRSIRCEQGDPVACYGAWRREMEGQGDSLLLVDASFSAYWLDEVVQLPLTYIYLLSEAKLYVSVTSDNLEFEGIGVPALYRRWAAAHGFVIYEPGTPLAFNPLHIAKPWGQEIWFTGVEQRGVCCFRGDTGETPIPWLQSALPDSELGASGDPLVLLKILDPVAEAVTGDLYFELHEEKQEVYVVTHVDPSAWPDGVGAIRMGFAPDKLSQYGGDDQGFRRAYLDAVQRYESVRRQLDSLAEEGGNRSDDSLFFLESKLRTEMDDFTQLRQLRLGDVVKVPLNVPHSLQHGVRTVEFQTPVYERKILSFAQKVLTQDHWDTPSAVKQMLLKAPPETPFEQVSAGDGLAVERIVDFDDFEVRRFRIDEGSDYVHLQNDSYGLLMVIEGDLTVSGAQYGPEQALILPRDWSGPIVSTSLDKPVVFLLATPCN